MAAAKTVNVEESFDKIDKIIEELQSGELSLNESFKKYKEGMDLALSCSKEIEKIEGKVKVIEDSMNVKETGTADEDPGQFDD